MARAFSCCCLSIITCLLLLLSFAEASSDPQAALPFDPRAAQDDRPQAGDVICTPFGLCLPCPEDALTQPFCQPFGNRRLMHCTNSTSPPASQMDSTPETPAWQACGRIVVRERADFYEWVGCNVLFAVVSIAVGVVRWRRGEASRKMGLAARIGVGGR
ncbi:hypothetical protein BDV98DRAFT_553360 [Pterulicium gracile]|uniref:Uncharacterized protein n=1 Tax=Pterulicium gracile TaxID=1884261 RepID=A0A5C3QA33_9AGAR|nr:hypothetical protein BDV98DRAFT_553360 [Pterula gracilis]